MMNGIAKQRPDLSPTDPIQGPERQHRGADGGDDIPGNGRGDGRVAEKRGENDKGEGEDPEDGRRRPRVQLRSLRSPVFRFVVG